MGLPRPPDSLVETLGQHFFLGRSTAFLPARHAVFHAARYRAALAASSKKPSPAERALRGRLLRLCGDKKAAAAELDAAIAAEPGLAEAWAWRWELQASAGPVSNADLERAVQLDPKNGWWRLWLALGRTTEGVRERALDDARAASKLMPKEALPPAVEGLIQFKLGLHAPAIEALTRALALDPAMEWAWRLRGMCRHEIGDAAGCLADSVAAMRLDENSGLLFVMFGLHKLKTDTRRSIETATAHIEKSPDDYWAYVFRADNRRSPEAGENLGAVEDLRRAAELEPKKAFVWAYLSRCQVTLGDFKNAAASIKRAVELDPECGWIRAWRGELLRRSGDFKGAAAELDRAVELFPDYELAYAWRGSARRELGKPEAALEDLGIAIALKPHTLDLCYFERMRAFRALGRTAEALEDVQKSSRLNPKYVWEAEPARFAEGLKELDAEIRRAPKNALAHLWRGDVMMRVRDFKRAEADLGRALASPDCPPEALILRGRARCELGRWTGAFADFDAAIEAEPSSAYGWAWRGRAKMLRGRRAEALKDFAKALERERNSAWLLSWKGEAECGLERWDEAEASLSKAIQVHVRFADAWLWRAVARAAKGDADGAWEDFTRAAELSPKSPAVLYRRGLFLLENEKPQEAAADLAAATAAPGPLTPAELKDAKKRLAEAKKRRGAAPAAPARLADAARALSREGRHAEAADIYGGLLKKSPKDPSLRRLRADAYRCLGRYDLALADLDAIVAAAPKSADSWSGRVEYKRHLRDFEGGLADAEKAVSLDPKSAPAWVLKSECLRSLGRWDEAVAAADRGAALDPGWNWAKIVRAKARRQKGDLDGALADTREAEKGGTDAYARGWRAEILRKAGRLDEALADLTVATGLQPTNAWFLALRGQLKVELGRTAEGWADLAQAMRLDTHCSCEHDFLGAEGPAVRADAALCWVLAWRGGVRRKEGRLAEARADLDRALAAAPDCFWILGWHGELLAELGEEERGLAELARALEAHPKWGQALVWEGRILLKLGRLPQARKSFDKALALDPADVWALIGRGVCLERSGDAAGAARDLARARELAPALFQGAPA